jgi:hypothetical protein
MPDRGPEPLEKDPQPVKARRRAAGFGLYSVLGIARDDHAHREA